MSAQLLSFQMSNSSFIGYKFALDLHISLRAWVGDYVRWFFFSGDCIHEPHKKIRFNRFSVTFDRRHFVLLRVHLASICKRSISLPICCSLELKIDRNSCCLEILPTGSRTPTLGRNIAMLASIAWSTTNLRWANAGFGLVHTVYPLGLLLKKPIIIQDYTASKFIIPLGYEFVIVLSLSCRGEFLGSCSDTRWLLRWQKFTRWKS